MQQAVRRQQAVVRGIESRYPNLNAQMSPADNGPAGDI
jgi:hypothetical protein